MAEIITRNPRMDKYINNINKNKNYIGLCLLLVFSWEHCFRLYDLVYRPTTVINFTTEYLRMVFEFIGIQIARLSSFLTWFDFVEIKKTYVDLYVATFDLMTSFVYTLTGYLEQSAEYIGEENLVYLGSILLLTSICIGFYYFYNNYRSKQYISIPKRRN